MKTLALCFILLLATIARGESGADRVKEALHRWEKADPAQAKAMEGANLSEEIKARLRKWENKLPQYVPGENFVPARLGPTVTAHYAVDRTGKALDPIATEFLTIGYFVLDRLEHHPEMALLNPEEMKAFHEALRTTRIRIVSAPLTDNKGKRVTAIYEPSGISVYREDWDDAKRLGADLVRLVFHEYLRAIRKNDDNYVVSVQLLVTQRDFEKQRRDSATCVSGHFAPIKIVFNLAIDYESHRFPSYVNGKALPSNTSFRVGTTSALCTSNAHRFDLMSGNVERSVYLFGGDVLTTRVPTGEEFYAY